jgi:hypothetical protein
MTHAVALSLNPDWGQLQAKIGDGPPPLDFWADVRVQNRKEKLRYTNEEVEEFIGWYSFAPLQVSVYDALMERSVIKSHSTGVWAESHRRGGGVL